LAAHFGTIQIIWVLKDRQFEDNILQSQTIKPAIQAIARDNDILLIEKIVHICLRLFILPSHVCFTCLTKQNSDEWYFLHKG